MTIDIQSFLVSLIGKRCAFETTDGSIRAETVTSVAGQSIHVRDGETVQYPVTVHFGRGEMDGVDIRSIKSIRLIGE